MLFGRPIDLIHHFQFLISLARRAQIVDFVCVSVSGQMVRRIKKATQWASFIDLCWLVVARI